MIRRLVLTSAVLVAVSAPLAAATPMGALPRPITDRDYPDAGEAKVELGRMLFFDRILSGNQNIACATCHHPDLGSGDGVPLALGEGPEGLGPERRPGESASTAVHERVPRNAPAIWNLGAREFDVLFHDGRVEADPHGYYAGGFITPAKWKLPPGLETPLAAQAMFPVGSPTEMAGQKGENPIADAVSLANLAGPGGVWEQLGKRLAAIPEYVNLFRAAYPGDVEGADDVSYVLAANAIAAFETEAFRSDDSPFDAYLRGDRSALDETERHGLALFYGKADCARCHSGPFQTDHDFHAIAMPQIGPGKRDGADASYWRATGEKDFLEDFGRGRVTMREEDRFRFRTPTLRNVALTAPYGHSGAYATLEEVVRHHLDPVAALEAYDPAAVELPLLGQVLELTATGSRLQHSFLSEHRRRGFAAKDTFVQRSPELRARIAAANELEPIALSDDEVRALVAFLSALTDPGARTTAHLVPERVPSGLPVLD